jgi:glutamate racemase
MSHKSSIGMFDSGVGGLTVMQEMMQLLPHESIIYFGDTARIPYGSKSQETITRYSIENTIFLLEKNIKLLVIACNTASALALPKLRQIFNIPIIGVIETGAEKAATLSRNQRFAILATKSTVQSEAYQKEILYRLPQSIVIPIACPLFVSLVEECFWNHPAASLIAKEYLAPLKKQQIDTVVLGCTHYPFLKNIILKELEPDVCLVDSASSCAEKVLQVLKEQNLETKTHSQPSYQYYVSDDPLNFKNLAENLFGYSIGHVQGI